MNPFAAIDWPTILAFVLVEAAFVLVAAPWLIQRRNEARAVDLFKTKLLPLLPAAPVVPSAQDVAAAVRQTVLDVLPAAPTIEQQVAARNELAAAFTAHAEAVLPGAVQAAIAQAVKGRIGAFSAQGVDARANKALNENALKARVGEKYGIKGLGALAILKNVDKSVYELGLDAVSFAPGSLDEWLEQNADRFSMGGAAASKRITVV